MKKWFWIFVVLLLVFLPIKAWIFYGTMTTVSNYEIIKTERVIDGNSSRYLIFAKQETLQNTDTWLALKFNSSDIYGKISVGQNCTFKVTGFRIPFFSWYRNILSATCK